MTREEMDFIGGMNMCDEISNEAYKKIMCHCEELEPCEDAISKHAVLETIDSRIEQIKRDADAINKSYSHLSYAEGVYNGYCRLKCDLWDLPSVTPSVEPCEDCISREEAEAIFKNARKSLYELSRKERVKDFQTREMMLLNAEQFIHLLPSVTPKFTDDEIQKMQDLEQAQLEKAYGLGKAEMQPCEDCISRTELLSRIDAERKHLLDLKMDGAEHILVHHARRIIEDMPSVAGGED